MTTLKAAQRKEKSELEKPVSKRGDESCVSSRVPHSFGRLVRVVPVELRHREENFSNHRDETYDLNVDFVFDE